MFDRMFAKEQLIRFYLLMVDPDSGLFKELMITKPNPSLSLRWIITSLVCKLCEAKPSGGVALLLNPA